MLSRSVVCHLRKSVTSSIQKPRFLSSTVLSLSNAPDDSTTANIIHQQTISNSATTNSTESTTTTSKPWYLRDAVKPTLTTPTFETVMPELPQDAPEQMKDIIQYMISMSGLTDFVIFDLRDRHEELPASRVTDFVIMCEGKSEKHLQNSSQDLISHLKKQFRVKPYIEGLLKPNSQMRLRQKLKKTGKSYKDAEFGIGPNSWIVIDTKIDNIYLHLVTPERREILNLEELFCEESEKELYRRKKEENSTYNLDTDSIFAGIFKRYYSTSIDDLEGTILKFVATDDFVNFDKLVSRIRTNSGISLDILESLNKELTSLNSNDLSIEKLENLKSFFDKSFPILPELSHFNQRFQFYRNLTILAPESFRHKLVSDNLKLQVEADLPLSNAQLIEFVNYLELLETDEMKKHELLKSIILQADVEFLQNEELTIAILKLFSHNESSRLSPFFNDFIRFLNPQQLSDNVKNYIINVYIQTSNNIKLWEFWNSIPGYSYSQTSGEVILDSRPWNALISAIYENSTKANDDAILNELFNKYLPEAINSNVSIDGSRVLALLNKFDQSGAAYSNIRASLIK